MRGGRRPGASRQGYRLRLKRLAREFYTRHKVWTVQRMSIGSVEMDWRIRLLTGPDTRSLTGRLMGDPQFLRSALYFHTLKEKSYG